MNGLMPGSGDFSIDHSEHISDIEEIKSRFRSTGIKNVFTRKELDMYAGSKYDERHLSGVFAAKKCIAEILGVICDKRIEIKYDTNGKPEPVMNKFLSGECVKKMIRSISVSISHSRNFVAALAVYEKYIN